MRRVVVIVFDSDAKANEGKAELLRLDSEGNISIYGYEVIAKKADGTVVVRQADGQGTLGAFAKSLLGNIDSTDSAPQAATWRAGNPADLIKTETGKDFIRDVMEVLLPNRVAIVLDVEEEWPDLLDIRMGSIGGTSFRWTVSEMQNGIEM